MKSQAINTVQEAISFLRSINVEIVGIATTSPKGAQPSHVFV